MLKTQNCETQKKTYPSIEINDSSSSSVFKEIFY